MEVRNRVRLKGHRAWEEKSGGGNNIVGKKQMGVSKRRTSNSILFYVSFLLLSSFPFFSVKVCYKSRQLHIFLHSCSFFSHKIKRRITLCNVWDVNWVTELLQGHKQNKSLHCKVHYAKCNLTEVKQRLNVTTIKRLSQTMMWARLTSLQVIWSLIEKTEFMNLHKEVLLSKCQMFSLNSSLLFHRTRTPVTKRPAAQ